MLGLPVSHWYQNCDIDMTAKVNIHTFCLVSMIIIVFMSIFFIRTDSLMKNLILSQLCYNVSSNCQCFG